MLCEVVITFPCREVLWPGKVIDTDLAGLPDATWRVEQGYLRAVAEPTEINSETAESSDDATQAVGKKGRKRKS